MADGQALARLPCPGAFRMTPPASDRTSSAQHEAASASQRRRTWGVAGTIYGGILLVALAGVHGTLGGADTQAGAAAWDRATRENAGVKRKAETSAVVLAAPRSSVATVVVREEAVLASEHAAGSNNAVNPLARTSPPATKLGEDALLALPQEEGGNWPRTMESATRDLSPHLAYGRLYGAPGGSRIVYLIDVSGSQVDTLPFVQQALQQAIRSLTPEQSYAVMFFSDDTVVEAPPAGMKYATTRAIVETNRFIDPQSGEIVATGPPSPEGAIRRAMAYQPDTVVLLSDGITGRRHPLADRARVLALIDAANMGHAVFHTIQVRDADPLANAQRRGTLEMIAARTGGVYRFVADDDLPVR